MQRDASYESRVIPFRNACNIEVESENFAHRFQLSPVG